MMDLVLAVKFELCLAPSSNLSPLSKHFLAHNATISPSPIIPIFMDANLSKIKQFRNAKQELRRIVKLLIRANQRNL